MSGEVIRFASVGNAVAFAEEVASTPQTRSLLQRLMQGPGGRGISRDDAQDVALTILALTSRIQPAPARLALRLAYGPVHETREQLLVDFLVDRAPVPARAEANPRDCARAAILKMRSWHQLRRRLPRSAYAHVMGIARQSLDPAWGPMIEHCEEALRGWHDRGVRVGRDILEEAGLMSASLPYG